MLEYVKKILLAQKKLAAQFDTAPQPEIMETGAYKDTAAEKTEQKERAGAGDEKGKMAEEDSRPEKAGTQSAEQTLRELTRQTMRLESIRMQNAAAQQQEQTRRMEQAMTALQQRQRIDLTAQTPDSGQSAMTGSYRKRMEFAGIASSPSQRSMQEISRFFERDARRYG